MLSFLIVIWFVCFSATKQSLVTLITSPYLQVMVMLRQYLNALDVLSKSSSNTSCGSSSSILIMLCNLIVSILFSKELSSSKETIMLRVVVHEQARVIGCVVVVDLKVKVAGNNHSLPSYALDDGVGSEVVTS